MCVGHFLIALASPTSRMSSALLPPGHFSTAIAVIWTRVRGFDFNVDGPVVMEGFCGGSCFVEAAVDYDSSVATNVNVGFLITCCVVAVA